MFPNGQLLIVLLAFLFFSCNEKNDKQYAIRDFRNKIQPYLKQIVGKGIVMYRDSIMQHVITDEELIQLSNSEHPILRATAFREMFDRNSINHFDLMMQHLNDTAVVATDAGEFGTWYRTVSDDILQEANWETEEAKNETIDSVLTKHNYLQSAYLILLQIEPKEKYYSFIKDMATRPRRMSTEGYELDFSDIETALFGLARFKKKQDVEIIKQKMMQHIWELSIPSFRLMAEYPDSAYMDVLQLYHRRKFYQFGSIPQRGGFTGIDYGGYQEEFIKALVIQKNERSAKLLDSILMRLPMMKNVPDKGYLEDLTVEAVWDNPCSAYTRLREEIKPKVEVIIKQRNDSKIDPMPIEPMPIDTTNVKIRWWR